MNYTTSVPVTGVTTPAMMAASNKGLGAPSPFQYRGPHADVYNGLAQGNLVDFQRAAQEADMRQMSQSRDTQLQTALRGLQQEAQAETNQRNLANQLYGNQVGMLNSLLSGLF